MVSETPIRPTVALQWASAFRGEIQGIVALFKVDALICAFVRGLDLNK